MQAESFIREVLKVKDENLIREALRFVETAEYKKGSYVIKEGEKSWYLTFLMNDGLVRGFYYDSSADGKEITECICFKAGQCITDRFDPSEEELHEAILNIQAMEDITVLRLSMGDARKLVRQYPDCQELAYRLVYEAGEFHANLKRLMATYSKEKLVQEFEKQYQELAGRLPAKEIASLLNVSERTVYRSRMRK